MSGSLEPWNKHLEQYLCWGQQLVPCYCFLITHSPAGTECLPSPPTSNSGPQSNQASATGVCLPCKSASKAKTNSFHPTPEVSRMSLSHRATQ